MKIDTSDTIDFVGIGAPRCGTTWLAECLRQHPDINLPIREGVSDDVPLSYFDLEKGKEMCFFLPGDGYLSGGVPGSSHWDKGVDWYLGRFPKVEKGKIRGEFTATYLSHPESSKLIHQTLPDVKIIVSLRNPADMLYSWYWFQQYGKNRLSFEEYIASNSYTNIGMYYKNLSRYTSLFDSKQIHIVFFEDIKSNTEVVVRDLYRFLGVDEEYTPSTINGKINATKTVRSSVLSKIISVCMSVLRGVGLGSLQARLASNETLYRLYCKINLSNRSYPPMRKEIRDVLRAKFRTDIEQLEKLTGRDLSAWK